MRVIATTLPGALVLEPRVFEDERGYFLESWNEERYAGIGVSGGFVQDNVSFSTRGVLRGMHYQQPNPQGKLVTVLQGTVFDVIVDLRVESPTFKQWYGIELSGATSRQLWVPPGFAHGFVVTSESALFHYKCTAYYSPASERSLRWDDPEIGIEWPVRSPTLSAKDQEAPLLADIPEEKLFTR